MGIEQRAIDLINETLADPKIPWKKLKSMKVFWDIVGNTFWLPVLHLEFYETDEEKKSGRTSL